MSGFSDGSEATTERNGLDHATGVGGDRCAGGLGIVAGGRVSAAGDGRGGKCGARSDRRNHSGEVDAFVKLKAARRKRVAARRIEAARNHVRPVHRKEQIKRDIRHRKVSLSVGVRSATVRLQGNSKPHFNLRPTFGTLEVSNQRETYRLHFTRITDFAPSYRGNSEERKFICIFKL